MPVAAPSFAGLATPKETTSRTSSGPRRLMGGCNFPKGRRPFFARGERLEDHKLSSAAASWAVHPPGKSQSWRPGRHQVS